MVVVVGEDGLGGSWTVQDPQGFMSVSCIGASGAVLRGGREVMGGLERQPNTQRQKHQAKNMPHDDG